MNRPNPFPQQSKYPPIDNIYKCKLDKFFDFVNSLLSAETYWIITVNVPATTEITTWQHQTFTVHRLLY